MRVFGAVGSKRAKILSLDLLTIPLACEEVGGSGLSGDGGGVEFVGELGEERFVTRLRVSG